MAGIDRWNWPRGSGSLVVQLRQAVQDGLSPQWECVNLQGPWVGHWEEEPLKEMEGPVSKVIGDGRVGLGKPQEGRPCPAGPLAPASVVQPLTLC